MATYSVSTHIEHQIERERNAGKKLLDRAISDLEIILRAARNYKEVCDKPESTDYDLADRLLWIAQAFANLSSNDNRAEMGTVAGKLRALLDVRAMSDVLNNE